MHKEESLRQIILSDPWRMKVLTAVRSQGLRDCWIAAGFVRNAVWDHLHGIRTTLNDVDVIHFDASHVSPENDLAIEQQLNSSLPEVRWSVKNQARMHLRNGHQPYRDCAEAMTYWPETSTSVAARLTADDGLEILAPVGLEDLFDMRVRRNELAHEGVFRARLQEKKWKDKWPNLILDKV